MMMFVSVCALRGLTLGGVTLHLDQFQQSQ